MIVIHIPERTLSKDNEKIFGKHGKPFTSKKFKDFEKRVRSYMQEALPKDFKMFEEEGIKVSISAMFRNRVRPDVGNIPKSILDAGNKLIWKDDRLITNLHTSIVYGDFDEILLTIEER